MRFYKDKNGKEPLKEYFKNLGNKTDKNSRLNYSKIRDYIKILSLYGTRAGEPFVKHVCGDIWELRPLRNRIFFFGYDGQQFILLSHFLKKSQKTPQKEIAKAKKLMSDYIERSLNDEK